MHFGAFASRGALQNNKACADMARGSFNQAGIFFSHVTNSQIVDGLDKFYADYRNRRILIYRATWIVVHMMAGSPQKELDDMLDYERQHVADN